MTRGTSILITNDNLLVSTEFNGDMYPEGYGDIFFKGLAKVKNNKEYQVFLDNFNNENFRYKEDMIYEYPHNLLCSWDYENDCKHIDLTEKYTEFFSDWLFFKNLTNSSISMTANKYDNPTVIKIAPGETLRFYFAEIPNDRVQYRI